jgi:hypothetical protein
METTRKLQAISADPVQVDPKHYAVELENNRVRVLRKKYGPGEKSVMHGHPAGVAVFLTDHQSRFTYPDGRTEDMTAQAGSIRWLDGFEHLVESLSDRPFELIIIELKE